jgi:hypothetical protein
MPSLRDLAKEARGSATWDAVKWLSAAAGSAMTVIVQAVYGYCVGYQNLAALLISGGIVVFLGLVAIVLHKVKPTTKISTGNGASPLSRNSEHAVARMTWIHLWFHTDRVLSEYRRLDYAHRNDSAPSTAHRFHPGPGRVLERNGNTCMPNFSASLVKPNYSQEMFLRS